MGDIKGGRSEREPPFAEWMKTSAAFWGPMSKMMSDVTDGMDSTSPAYEKWNKNDINNISDAATKTWENLVSTMAENQVTEALFQLSDEMSKIAQDGWNDFKKQNKQGTKNVEKEEREESSHTKGLDQNSFAMLMSVYESCFQKFLNTPKIGLNRLFQEKISQTTDKLIHFNIKIAEFLYLLSVPIKKAFKDMQEELTELSKNGTLLVDDKEHYNKWIEKVEKYYLSLYQSPQYTKVFGQTISAMGEFLSKRDEILQDVLKMYPISTQKDIDSLCQDIYHLKKRLKKLEKKERGIKNRLK